MVRVDRPDALRFWLDEPPAWYLQSLYEARRSAWRAAIGFNFGRHPERAWRFERPWAQERY